MSNLKLLAGAVCATACLAADPCLTGNPNGTFEQAIDAKVCEILSLAGTPQVGASVAITKDGKLILAKGYGKADVEGNIDATPTTLYRIASVSKSITALGILRLVEQGQITLDQIVFGPTGILKSTDLAPLGGNYGSNVQSITVRHLLQHTSGFPAEGTIEFSANTAADSNPATIELADEISSQTGDPRPVEIASVLRYQIAQNTLSVPGSTYLYSNIGFAALGQVIKKASGKSYAQFIQDNVLGPIAIQRLRLAKTRLEDRAPTEARYYMGAGQASPMTFSVFPPHAFPMPDGLVPRPYGAFYIESFDSLGGWLASAVDLARIMARLDDRVAVPVVTPSSLALIRQPPSYDPAATIFDGLGFIVELDTDPNTPLTYSYSHIGSLAGTKSYVKLAAEGLGLAVVLNYRDGFGTVIDNNMLAKIRNNQNSILSIMRTHNTAGTLPSTDLFPGFLRPTISSISNEASKVKRTAPGMYITIQGTNLGPVVSEAPGTRTLPTTFRGIRVKVGSLFAPIRYLSAGEVGAIVPYNASGNVSIQVLSGDESASLSQTLDTVSPGLYTSNGSGTGTALARHQNGSIASSVSSGQIIALFVTGEGQTTPPGVDGSYTLPCTSGGLVGWGYPCINGNPPNPIPVASVKATIGALNAPVIYAGNAPLEQAGKMVVLVQVPFASAGVKQVKVTVGSKATQNGVSIYQSF